MGRMKTLVAAFVAALVAAPAALADGLPQQPLQFGGGVARGPLHYVALGDGDTSTLLAEVRGGQVNRGVPLDGAWGIPRSTYTRSEGLSRDGKLLFLQSLAFGGPTTEFLILSTRTFAQVDRFTLQGSFSFDALSPDASRLYPIQNVDQTNENRYVVRASDLRTNRLLPGRIADRTQKGWVMEGTPVSRAATPGGRWVYTLYSRPGGYPFVHALDTVRGVAHCVGIPWTNPNQAGLWNLVLHARGQTLSLDWRSGRPGYRLDRTTWKLARVPGGSFPWWWPALGGVAAACAAMERLRRRRRSISVSVQGGSDVPTPGPRPRGRPRPRAGGVRRSAVVHRAAGR